jgi:hypothetical protein
VNPRASKYKIEMPECTVRNIMKHAREVKMKGKVASCFVVCKHLQGTSVTVIEIQSVLSVWIEDWNKKIHSP